MLIATLATAGFAAAEAKRGEMLKEKHIANIEQAVAEREQEARVPNENLEPAEPADQPENKDDRNKFGRFDSTVGNNAQATPRHPMGDAMALVREGQKAKEFFDHERAQMRFVKKQIEEGIKARWG